MDALGFISHVLGDLHLPLHMYYQSSVDGFLEPLTYSNSLHLPVQHFSVLELSAMSPFAMQSPLMTIILICVCGFPGNSV